MGCESLSILLNNRLALIYIEEKQYIEFGR